MCDLILLQHVIMNGTFEETMLSVWRQVMVDDFAVVVLDDHAWPVKRTPQRRLRQVDFQFDGKDIRGLEQNSDTKSRWAQMARAGKRVMQFLADTGYVAVVVDGKMHFYGKSNAKLYARGLPRAGAIGRK